MFRLFTSFISYYISRRSTVLETVPQLFNMENSVILGGLLERLAKAEDQIRLLGAEVKGIKHEIMKVKINIDVGSGSVLSTNSSGSGKRQRQTVLIPTPSNREPDSPPSKRHKDEDDDATDGETDFKYLPFMKENDFVLAYTDGACENNGKANAKAGIGVWFGENHPLNISKPVDGRPTNNTAEIQACVECLQLLKDNGIRKVKIFTDSQFTISCITSWIHRWKKNNWKTAGGAPVKNKEDLEKLDAIMKQFDKVEYVHVAGHKGIAGNEGADLLARRGAALYRK